LPNVTLAVPEELHKIMKSHPEIKWSEIARQAMKEYALRIEVLDDITAKSKFTEKDAFEMGEDLKKDLAARYKKIMKRKGLDS
jgi:hypothetical protein